MPKQFLAVLAAVITMSGLVLCTAEPVEAVSVTTLQDLRIDNSTAETDDSFHLPTQITLVPIFMPKDFDGTSFSWYRGLHYYLKANDNRPGFTDIPFHYAVTKEGEIFAGNSGGEEQQVAIEGVGNDMVSIAYLAGKNENSFDPRAKSALQQLVTDIANRHNITADNISLSGVEYLRDSERELILLQEQRLFGLWQTSLEEVKDYVAANYSPQDKEYNLQILEVKLPEAGVTGGEEATLEITIQNNGEFGIYPDSSTEILATKTSGASQFFIQNKWASSSQFYLMEGDADLLPGESETFTARLGAPLVFGERKESFRLQTVGGVEVPDTEFEIALDVQRPDGNIVEIIETGTGWLRVRSAPSGGADNEIARATVGERYFQLDNSGNGWIKIRLKDGREGWVAVQYTREV